MLFFSLYFAKINAFETTTQRKNACRHITKVYFSLVFKILKPRHKHKHTAHIIKFHFPGFFIFTSSQLACYVSNNIIVVFCFLFGAGILFINYYEMISSGTHMTTIKHNTTHAIAISLTYFFFLFWFFTVSLIRNGKETKNSNNSKHIKSIQMI